MPRGAKLWLGFAVVWIASPMDLVPEFIPVAGLLDDAVVAALVLRHLLDDGSKRGLRALGEATLQHSRRSSAGGGHLDLAPDLIHGVANSNRCT